MTTIVTNGKFLISDRRLTQAISHTSIAAGKAKNYSHEAYLDVAVKTCVPENAYYFDKKVLAFAGAGGATFYNNFCAVTELDRYKKTRLDLVSLMDILDGTPCPDNHTLAEIVMVLEDGTSAVFSLSGELRKGIYVYRSDIKTYKEDEIFVAGSGSQYWNTLNKAFLEDFKPTPYEVFLLCAHMDPFSSESYSAYSLEDNHFFVEVNPTDLDVSKALARFQHSVQLWNPIRKPTSLRQL